ncbi:Zinc/iron permease [Tuber magnatum]|uniref:Zinc/iron permease n=1 Tax=Tuber magnatum TaxID=42249 RepID=A0A317SEE4_9PEZI|nr:Zinc/iron permease [Tuber magnatum]
MDQRGWILACASGAACVLGSTIICLDTLLRRLPFRRFQNFSIRESSTFLAASLSLSFGVMFFSALYGMLPKSREYLLTSGLTPAAANAVLMTAFLGGVGGLQIVSELLHYFLPSSIVSCDEHGRVSMRVRGRGRGRDEGRARIDERAPLLGRQHSVVRKISASVSNLVRGCVGGAEGKCYGFSDHDCEQKCAGERIAVPGSSGSESPSHGDDEVSANRDLEGGYRGTSHEVTPIHHEPHHHHRHHHDHPHSHSRPSRSRSTIPATILPAGDVDPSAPGHHHVADNQFLSIGVQTSIAIAIHKIPEGFITYTTNHANPTLALPLFLAIFIHNITEGFAMSLPLYLALKSRTYAILWASLLGGLSQPLGAGVAALGLLHGGGEVAGHEWGYGVLFAVTSGIMCSVGLQLFSQAVGLHHGGRVPFVWGFLGMGVVGASFGVAN